jgi:hypothetical protein
MAAICESCGEETPRYVMKFYSGKAHYTCHVCEHPRHSVPRCTNPYSDMVIDHVVTEEGKPLRVTSRRQLEAAEKRYHFRSLVAHTDSANFDKPPQDKLAALHPADRIAQQMQEQVGRRDSNGNKLGFLFPEQANALLREVKEKGIDIATW